MSSVPGLHRDGLGQPGFLSHSDLLFGKRHIPVLFSVTQEIDLIVFRREKMEPFQVLKNLNYERLPGFSILTVWVAIGKKNRPFSLLVFWHPGQTLFVQPKYKRGRKT
ncbi:hypothetical protein E2320_018302 [Naja naja]|nr:hypothetical protein E2320_018302 [Naja naja]